MTKKHFIALADDIRRHNKYGASLAPFGKWHLETLANSLKRQNPNFNRERWLDYIEGKCGPNGGTIKDEHTD